MADRVRVPCPHCGTPMNRHAEKIDYGAGLADPAAFDPTLGGVLEEFHTCPDCRFVLQRASQSGPSLIF
jgi:hypothetical protein